MLDSEAPERRRGPGRHRRTPLKRRGATLATLVQAMSAWFARVKRGR
jgi:hypothetical protein